MPLFPSVHLVVMSYVVHVIWWCHLSPTAKGVTVENCDFLQGIVDVYDEVSQYLVFEYLYDRQHGIKREVRACSMSPIDAALCNHCSAVIVPPSVHCTALP